MKISVIIPCYNQGHFLKKTCQSLINQTYVNWEAIIVNDGSRDNTKKVSVEICKKDNRFKYVYQKNKGLSSARNTGLNLIKGDFVQFLDADDYLLEEKFSLSIFESKKADIVISDFNMFSEEITNKIDAYCDLSQISFDLNSILLQWDINFTIPIHCGFFSKNSINNIQFDTTLKAKEDWFFWIEIFFQNPKIFFLDKKLALYRIHDSSMTTNNSHMQKNKFLVFDKIFNKLSGNENVVFFRNRLIKELIEEQSKNEYLFGLKKENEELLKKLEQKSSELKIEIETLKLDNNNLLKRLQNKQKNG